MATFIIQELINNNPTQTGVRFEWSTERNLFPTKDKENRAAAMRDASVSQPNGAGSFAAPQGNWSVPMTLRTKRTDYPGVSRPSEQVLGANYEPFTLAGFWDDRYNYGGYAKETWEKMDGLVKRGNLCRFQYEDVVYHGIITGFTPEYEGSWRVNYTITVSPHYRDIDPGGAQKSAGEAVLTVGDVYNKTDKVVANLQQANQDRLDSRFTGSVLADVDRDINRVDLSRSTIALSLDYANLNPITKPITQWNKFASQFVETQTAAQSVLTVTSPLRADTDIISPTAVVLLSFESWVRSTRAAARAVRFEAIKAVKEMRKRFKPKSSRLYRPHQGESIFAISNKFYGTPTAWRLIAERNKIDYFEFTGDELLVIPERGNV